MSMKVEYDTLVFPSVKNEYFRMHLNQKSNDSKAPTMEIWLESKKTRNQWQFTLHDVAKVGHAIPFDAFVECMKTALSYAEVGDDDKTNIKEHTEDPNNRPSIDLIMKNDLAILTLSFSLFGAWRPEYRMELVPLTIDRVDILQAQLRDAHDEIIMLKEEAKVSNDQISLLNNKVAALQLAVLQLNEVTISPPEQVLLVLSSSVSSNHYIYYNVKIRNHQGFIVTCSEGDKPVPQKNTNPFTFGAPPQTVQPPPSILTCQITVKLAGIYRIEVACSKSLSRKFQPGNPYVAIRINGIDDVTAKDVFSDQSFGSAHLSTICHLQANDSVDVCLFGCEIRADDGLKNGFVMMKIV